MMFDSNVGINGIPNILNGGGIGNPVYDSSYNNPNTNILSANGINNSMGITQTGAQDQAVLNNNFNNFGQQTDYYSAAGAAYGRNTGGFVSNGVAYDANGQPTVFETGTQPVDYADLNANGLPGYGLPPPQTSIAPPQQPYSATFDTRFDAVSPPATFDQRFSVSNPNRFADRYYYDNAITPPAQTPTFNDRFSPAPPINLSLQPPTNPLPDIIITGPQPPPLQEPMNPIVLPPPNPNTTFQERWNIETPDPNRFAERYGQWGPNPGTPSQYYTGTQYPNVTPLPPGYAPPYSFDNQNGALPLDPNRFAERYRTGGK